MNGKLHCCSNCCRQLESTAACLWLVGLLTKRMPLHTFPLRLCSQPKCERSYRTCACLTYGGSSHVVAPLQCNATSPRVWLGLSAKHCCNLTNESVKSTFVITVLWLVMSSNLIESDPRQFYDLCSRQLSDLRGKWLSG